MYFAWPSPENVEDLARTDSTARRAGKSAEIKKIGLTYRFRAAGSRALERRRMPSGADDHRAAIDTAARGEIRED